MKVMIVIEMMGRPVDHLKQVMKDFLKRLDQEKGIKIVSKKTHNPKKVEQKDKEGQVIQVPEGKEMYSSFSEIELEVATILDLARIVFAYMPSHIEILHPTDLKMQNFDLATIFNEITKKMHQYDAISKNALMQNQMLANKLMQMQEALQQAGIKEQHVEDTREEKPAKKKAKKKSSKKNTQKGIKKK